MASENLNQLVYAFGFLKYNQLFSSPEANVLPFPVV
jgi:hypothetical protein